MGLVTAYTPFHSAAVVLRWDTLNVCKEHVVHVLNYAMTCANGFFPEGRLVEERLFKATCTIYERKYVIDFIPEKIFPGFWRKGFRVREEMEKTHVWPIFEPKYGRSAGEKVFLG